MALENLEGKLFLVGLGPGDPSLQTPAALAALREADVWVGYRGYIVQVTDLSEGKELVSMELGQELEHGLQAPVLHVHPVRNPGVGHSSA